MVPGTLFVDAAPSEPPVDAVWPVELTECVAPGAPGDEEPAPAAAALLKDVEPGAPEEPAAALAVAPGPLVTNGACGGTADEVDDLVVEGLAGGTGVLAVLGGAIAQVFMRFIPSPIPTRMPSDVEFVIGLVHTVTDTISCDCSRLT